ncbi:hypothetical protein LCL96_04230 [Rossellomorea aquimaris]|uniref:hypothetical protein n=1 Tax=Rossellomorea aquimaris TaxID=189382 RepID=UPI001CD342D0|nr:hypothetical protein [Rossellomorea aquimaris]MCA1058125.1 hypothetical protein [Rossellomorea aquimaris]
MKIVFSIIGVFLLISMLGLIAEKLEKSGKTDAGKIVTNVGGVIGSIGCFGILIISIIGMFGAIFSFGNDDEGYYDNTPSEWGPGADSNNNPGTHQVDGYYRSDGTYVEPYIRSNPDGNPYNNLNQ